MKFEGKKELLIEAFDRYSGFYYTIEDLKELARNEKKIYESAKLQQEILKKQLKILEELVQSYFLSN
jgi:hypothetical protein